MSVKSRIAGSPADTEHREVSDATVKMWVRTIEVALPAVDGQVAREAMSNLVAWMSKFTPAVIRKLAARFQVPESVVADILADLPSVLYVFLTCPTSQHSAASPGVTGYLRYADAAIERGEEPRSFHQWCFFGTRTRLFSYLKQTFRAYGAPPELFRARESGQKARRRLTMSGQLVEYLRSARQPDGTEIWCHRVLHPDGQRPLNAVRSAERRFLTKPHAELKPEFILNEEHFRREQELLDRLDVASGIFEVRFLGNTSHPAILLWLFETLYEPFPLKSTTLDTILTASTRFHRVDSEWAAQQEAEDIS
jgi:hypothetical protein